MLEAGLNAQERRKVVDKVAAAVMLQAWLDHRRGTLGQLMAMPRHDAARSAAARGAGRSRRPAGPRLADRSLGRERSDRHGRAPPPPDAADQVDRLRPDGRRHRRHHDRRRRRLVVPRPDEPRGRRRRRAELHRARGRRPRLDLRTAARPGPDQRRRRVRVVRRTQRRPGDHPRVLRDPARRPRRQRARPPAHAARARRTPRSPSPRASPSPGWPSGSIRRSIA